MAQYIEVKSCALELNVAKRSIQQCIIGAASALQGPASPYQLSPYGGRTMLYIIYNIHALYINSSLWVGKPMCYMLHIDFCFILYI